MTESIEEHNSRILGVAKKLVGTRINAKTVYAKKVILTGEVDALQTKNGQWCFLDSLRLMCRVVGPLIVALPPVDDAFEAQVRELCQSLWSRQPITFTSASEQLNFSDAEAILSVGSEINRSLPWTSINSNGWVARVTSGATPLPANCGQPNPVAALMAASFGVAEVFKRLFEAAQEEVPLLDGVEFSLFELSSTFTDLGPELPSEIAIPDTVLFGAGAIGNAVALLASQLSLVGRLLIIDKQDYAPENRETCCLTERNGWVCQAKAERLAAWLDRNSQLEVRGVKALIADALASDKLQGMSVDLVLNGLDDVKARHETQGLWPSIMIDGGINEVGAAVVQHRLKQSHMACLICSFQLPKENLEKKQRQATGLSAQSLREQDRAITQEDIDQAAPERRAWLEKMADSKKTICSVITEAFKSLGIAAEEGFQPSAPFIASAAAALMGAEAVKALCCPDVLPSQRFILANLFLGPSASIALQQEPLSTCKCVVHRVLIVKSFERRQTGREKRSARADALAG